MIVEHATLRMSVSMILELTSLNVRWAGQPGLKDQELHSKFCGDWVKHLKRTEVGEVAEQVLTVVNWQVVTKHSDLAQIHFLKH